MFNRKSKQKSTPIVLVTPGDVISAQHLLKVEQSSLHLFFTRSYYSYKFIVVYLLLLSLTVVSLIWLVITRENYPDKPGFTGVEACISCLSVLELVWRCALRSVCSYVKEPLHWVDWLLWALWFVALWLLFVSTDTEYYRLVVAIHGLFSLRIGILLFLLTRYLFKSAKSRSKRDSNTNILNISHLPGEREEVEVIVLDDTVRHSQPTQQDHSQRHLQMSTTPVQGSTAYYTADKGDEAGVKLAAEED